MGKMHQIVGSYNAQKLESAKARRVAFEARRVTESALKARKSEIADLVRMTFWAVKPWQKRGPATMFKAYQTAEKLAVLGGEDYQEAVKVLRFAFTGREAYADACAAMLVGVND